MQTSKHVGANVEGDLEAEEIVHTFALSKDENKSKAAIKRAKSRLLFELLRAKVVSSEAQRQKHSINNLK